MTPTSRSKQLARRKQLAAAQRARYARNKAAGLCRCGRDRVEGLKSCQKCLDRRNAAHQKSALGHMERRMAKARLGFCTTDGCNSEAVPGFKTCCYHLEENAERAARLRRERSKQGRCRCGAIPEKGLKCCPKCLNAQRLRRLRRIEASKQLNHTRKAA